MLQHYFQTGYVFLHAFSVSFMCNAWDETKWKKYDHKNCHLAFFLFNTVSLTFNLCAFVVVFYYTVFDRWKLSTAETTQKKNHIKHNYPPKICNWIRNGIKYKTWWINCWSRPMTSTAQKKKNKPKNGVSLEIPYRVNPFQHTFLNGFYFSLSRFYSLDYLHLLLATFVTFVQFIWWFQSSDSVI